MREEIEEIDRESREEGDERSEFRKRDNSVEKGEQMNRFYRPTPI